MAETPTPLNATYYANLAALEFQRSQALAADKAGREQTEAGYNYNKGQYEKAEPLKLTANRNNANAAGILESGQLAKRQGETQTDFTTKQGRLSDQRRAAIEKYNSGDQQAENAFRVGQNKALAESTEQAKKELLENPPQPQAPAYPTPPAQQKAIEAGTPAGPGGVVPYEGGGVRVGPARPNVVSSKAQPNSAAIRKAAAKKAVG